MRENILTPVDEPGRGINPPQNVASRRILGPWANSDSRLARAKALYAKPRTSVSGRRGKARASWLKSRKMNGR